MPESPAHWSLKNNQETAKAFTEIPSVAFTIAAEAGNVINVALQVVDGRGETLNQQLGFQAWLSDTAGGAVSGTAPSTGVAIGTDGVIVVEHTAELFFELLTDADGVLDLDVGEAGVDTWYLNVRLPGGTVVTSGAITFA